MTNADERPTRRADLNDVLTGREIPSLPRHPSTSPTPFCCCIVKIRTWLTRNAFKLKRSRETRQRPNARVTEFRRLETTLRKSVAIVFCVCVCSLIFQRHDGYSVCIRHTVYILYITKNILSSKEYLNIFLRIGQVYHSLLRIRNSLNQSKYLGSARKCGKTRKRNFDKSSRRAFQCVR